MTEDSTENIEAAVVKTSAKESKPEKELVQKWEWTHTLPTDTQQPSLFLLFYLFLKSYWWELSHLLEIINTVHVFDPKVKWTIGTNHYNLSCNWAWWEGEREGKWETSRGHRLNWSSTSMYQPRSQLWHWGEGKNGMKSGNFTVFQRRAGGKNRKEG